MQKTSDFSFGSLLVGKVVVVDTSSLLIAGTKLISTIRDCELVIPAVVINELEDKRSHPTLGMLARQWINLIEGLRKEHKTALRQGVFLEEHSITFRVEPNHSNQTVLPVHLQNGSHDSTILAVACNLKAEFGDAKEVVVVSNDTPMRLKATLDLGLEAYEFSSALLGDRTPYTSRATVTLTDQEFIDFGLTTKGNYDLLEAVLENYLVTPAGYHMLIDVKIAGNSNFELNLRLEGSRLFDIDHKVSAHRIYGRTMEQDVALSYLKAPATEIPVVSMVGSAGTGKTLLTVAAALEAIKEGTYHKVFVFRSLHEMGQGQEMGFLPGDVDAKMGPWGGAIGDALDVIAITRKPEKKNEGPAAREDRKKIAEKLSEAIEVSPITYLRGRSLSKSFIILDEAQNFSRTELLNIIARVGEGSKLVIISDPYQVDNRFLQSGHKADIWSVIKGFKDESVFAHITLRQTERSQLAEMASKLLELEN